MKNYLILTLLVVLSTATGFAKSEQNNKHVLIETWLRTQAIQLHLPAFHSSSNVEGQNYELKNLLQENQIDLKQLNATETKSLQWNGQTINWKKTSGNSKGFLSVPNSKTQLYYFVSYINSNQWTKIKLIAHTYPMLEIYVDGEKKLSHYEHESKQPKEISKEITLEQGKHCIVVKLLSGADNNKFKLAFEALQNWNKDAFELSLSPQRYLNIKDILDGKKTNSTQVSSDGKMALISYSRTLPPSDETEYWSEIQEISSGKIIHTFRGSQLNNFQWLPNTARISYTKSYHKKTSLFVFDLPGGKETELASNIADFSSYTWSPTEKYIVYSVTKDYSEDWKIRKIQGMEDRLPWFRTRSFLYKLDAESGTKQRLTYGSLSTTLNDISHNGKHILFSQSRPDYNEYPYSKQNLYQMNVETFEVDTVWKDKLFGGFAQYSPDDTQVLVQGGPSCFGKTGENKGKQALANNYDGQLYIFDTTTKQAEPINLSSINNLQI